MKEGTFVPYIKRLKKLEQMHSDRLLMNEIYVKNELQLIEEDYEKEKELALQEFEVKQFIGLASTFNIFMATLLLA